jgi:DnaK suppressor protein
MNAEELNHHRKLLLSRFEDLQRILMATERVRAESHQTASDIADQANQSYERELSVITEAQHREQMSRITAALGRIETGEYGVCASCRGEISHARLEAVPWARNCLECQQRVERR